MNNTKLKKKLSTFRSPKGVIKNVSTEVLHELLKAWEDWSGPTMEFYQSIGVSHRQAAGILGKAKKLHREGAFGALEFNEIKVGELLPGIVDASPAAPCSLIELQWEGGKLIRFPQVEQLLDFLKKTAA